MKLLRRFFFRPKSLVCLSLPAGDYSLTHFIEWPQENELPDHTTDLNINLAEAPLAIQLDEIFNCVREQAHEARHDELPSLLMNSFLRPITNDPASFRSEMIDRAIDSSDLRLGFISDTSQRNNWSFRDTVHCESWLINLLCDVPGIHGRNAQSGGIHS